MIERIGKWFNQKVKNISYALGFFTNVLKESFLFVRQKQVGVKVLIMQIYFTGVEALSIISLIALALGVVIIIQGLSLLPSFGQGKLIYLIMIIIITRELGPMLCAFIIIARSGTAIATEIGNMVVNHEIEAYISVGINPISYLVVPRFFGVSITLVLLTFYFNFFGLFASFLISQLITPVAFTEYFQNLLQAMHLSDILSSLIKSLVFGIIISIVSAYNGFKVRFATTEIPQVVIKAVGQSFVICIIADAIIASIFYIIK
ncbi:MAG: ABC transporter permease [Spirochaetia bacterium]|jgi:phospholipid/cholesterol/gamma-HCH transport system permease protein